MCVSLCLCCSLAIKLGSILSRCSIIRQGVVPCMSVYVCMYGPLAVKILYLSAASCQDAPSFGSEYRVCVVLCCQRYFIFHMKVRCRYCPAYLRLGSSQWLSVSAGEFTSLENCVNMAKYDEQKMKRRKPLNSWRLQQLERERWIFLAASVFWSQTVGLKCHETAISGHCSLHVACRKDTLINLWIL
jgi:hypothetical protein